MLIPYGTDAPIYHYPYATVGMIVVCSVSSIAVWGLSGGTVAINWESKTAENVVSELILTYGHGLRPWQWITSNFVHGDLLHLLGNMFCLWGFGLVVEGKTGWWRFLLIALGIGVTQCAAEQTLMLLVSEGGSLGASSIIFGLVAICMIWAPRNEMNCILFILFRPVVFQASLYSIAGIALLIEFVTGTITAMLLVDQRLGVAIGSQVLHLMGAALGLGVGIFMLKKRWIDCEGWDLFSVWKDMHLQAKDDADNAAAALLEEAHRKRMQSFSAPSAFTPPANYAPVAVAPVGTFAAAPVSVFASLTPPVDPALAQMREALAAGDAPRALAAFQAFAADPLNWPLPERELLQTIALFQKQKQWSASVPAMVEYLRHFEERAPQVRLKLAQIALEIQRNVAQAAAVLDKLNASLLAGQDRETYQQLRARADALLAQQPIAPDNLD